MKPSTKRILCPVCWGNFPHVKVCKKCKGEGRIIVKLPAKVMS